MSETIRDQALRAALAILDSEKQIAFITFQYAQHTFTKQTEKPQVYRAKVTVEQAEEIMRQQGIINQYKDELKNQPVGKTIDDLINGPAVTYLGGEPQAVQPRPDNIYGVITNPNGLPSLILINSIFGYEQLAGVEIPLDQLKYVHAVLPLTTESAAQQKETELVNVVSKRIKENFNVNFAKNLLGDEGYNDVIKTLNKPVDKE